MKTLNQIIRYTSHCRFSDEDWQKVLCYCRERFKGGKTHKALKPISTSTYTEFLDWIDHGLGSGDMVSYGNTPGIIVSSTPDKTLLTAYLDYDGNLMTQQMEVLNPERLMRLDDKRSRQLRKLLIDNGLDYSPSSHGLVSLCTLKENLYVVIGDNDDGTADVGMYLESDGYKHRFAALVKSGELLLDCWIDTDYTPLRRADSSDIQRFHKIISKAGYTYNARVKQFIKQPNVGSDNIYYYLNDRFEIVTDKDNGGDVHAARFAVGNYFLDFGEALMFMKEVRKMRGGDSD